MRGKPHRAYNFKLCHRITPADAGKTPFLSFFLPFLQDHPRGCGENRLHRIPAI